MFPTDHPQAATDSRIDAATVDIDVGLRQHMLSVYNWMASGLFLTAMVAWGVASTSLSSLFYGLVRTDHGMVAQPTLLGYVAMLAPLGFVFFLGSRADVMSRDGLRVTFWAFCATIGLSMASLCAVYVGTSIALVFVVSMGMFAGTSLYGYATGADLSRMGNLLAMAVIGLLVAMVVNMLVGSSMLQVIISLAGVAIFTGLTAWDTQKIKCDYLDMQAAGSDGTTRDKAAVLAALSLYLNFLNMFQFLLQLMGVRRND